ncbi:MAG: translation initiation factor IF-2 [Flavobacterium sp.]|nr:translation initiation factor IF-2 [Flavobacterium sp.]
MSEERIIRINRVLRELNISLERAVDYLKEKGISVESNPNAKISDKEFDILQSQFAGDKGNKEASKGVSEEIKKEKEALRLEREKEIEDKRKADEERQRQEVIKARVVVSGPKQVGTIDLNPKPIATIPANVEKPIEAKALETPVVDQKQIKKVTLDAQTQQAEKTKITKKVANNPTEKLVEKPVEKIAEIPAEPVADETFTTQYQKLSGATLTGQVIDLAQFNKPKKTTAPKINSANKVDPNKNKRKRIPPKPGEVRPNTTGGNATGTRPPGQGGQGANKFGPNKPGSGGGYNKGARPAIVQKVEPTEEDVKNQIKETLERLQGKGSKSKAAKYRRDKRDTHRQRSDEEQKAIDEGSKTIKVTEFVTVGEVATMMDVPITKVIGTCMSLGLMVTMNQRLDAETLSIVADEFGYEVEFITSDIEDSIEIIADKEEDLINRAPIVTVMGHVDHGKTSLLDNIRKENVIAGESGGITQHIGAYGVMLEGGQKITFLDTPGHEAFTAMRARGAQVTDIAIIVIAADDDIMPQTKEAISHAQAANVPMIFAINKIDKPGANPEKIKEKLASMNLLVEDWGGKYQSHDISAKSGIGVKELLEKVLLEAEILDLKANPNKPAVGTVVEAQLDKGRGYISTILVQSGTLKIGDYVLAGKNHGKVKAMHDERGNIVLEAGPSTPISILGLDGASTAGDKFNVFEDEREAKQIATKRTQLMREQSVRTQRHITLAEIGRRIALGQFKELNIILKGDVDGSVEALSSEFTKLSTEEIQINIIHKGVGAITETDVMLASASDAIIIGFNVRPAGNARQLAVKEEIDIRNYSIIYDAINDLKDAMEGMLSPEMKEEITGTAEIREIFKVSKVGTIAGCMVTDGKIFRNSKIRIIREGVVVFTGELSTLKRFKDDVKDVSKGYDCGMQIKNYNDIEQLDLIEAFQEVMVKKKLK